MLSRSFFREVAAGVLVLLVSGCASLLSSPPVNAPPRAELESFALEGRFALSQASKHYSGRISWKHRGASSELLLSSPFGQGLAEIVSDAHGARLVRADGKMMVAADAESLIQEVLGYPLPLTQMADWMRGRVVSGQGSVDPLGRALSLEQAGWHIDYGYDTQDPASPPVRMVVKRGGDFELRLFVDEWRSLSPEEENP